MTEKAINWEAILDGTDSRFVGVDWSSTESISVETVYDRDGKIVSQRIIEPKPQTVEGD